MCKQCVTYLAAQHLAAPVIWHAHRQTRSLLPKVWDQMLEDSVEPNDDSRTALLRTCPPGSPQMDQITHRWPSGSGTPMSSASSTQQQVGFRPSHSALLTSSCKLSSHYQTLPDVAAAVVCSSFASGQAVAFSLGNFAQGSYCSAPVQSKG